MRKRGKISGGWTSVPPISYTEITFAIPKLEKAVRKVGLGPSPWYMRLGNWVLRKVYK